MFVAWLLYFIILSVWGTLSYMAISTVLRYKQPGIGSHKIVFLYLLFSSIVIVTSFITMVTIDWNSLVI